MGRILIALGLVLLVVGVVVQWGPGIPLGRLPGDLRIERPGFTLYVPITTSIVVSVVLSGVMWLVSKFH
jgi:hypothetical protein